MKTLLPLAALAAGLLVAPAAVAAPASTTVRHADLSLATDVGVARLDRRIASAAREVCGDAASFDRSARKAIAQCRTDTRAFVAPQRERVIAAARADVAFAAR